MLLLRNMALTDILNKIIEEARAQAALLMQKADEQVAEMQKTHEASSAKLKQQWQQKASQKIQELKTSFEKLRQSGRTTKVEKEQNRVIEKGLDLFVKHLSENSAAAEAVLKKIMQKLPSQPGKIFCTPALASFIKKEAPASYEVVEKEVGGHGMKVKLRHATLDATFETLVKSEYRQVLTDKVARHLGFLS